MDKLVFSYKKTDNKTRYFVHYERGFSDYNVFRNIGDCIKLLSKYKYQLEIAFEEPEGKDKFPKEQKKDLESAVILNNIRLAAKERV